MTGRRWRDDTNIITGRATDYCRDEQAPRASRDSGQILHDSLARVVPRLIVPSQRTANGVIVRVRRVDTPLYDECDEVGPPRLDHVKKSRRQKRITRKPHRTPRIIRADHRLVDRRQQSRSPPASDVVK